MLKKTATAIALSSGLFLSAELGGNTLSSDAFLWAAEPSHAYGLLAFVFVDLALIATLWYGMRYAGASVIARHAGTLATAAALVQFLAMVGDLAGFQPPLGMSPSAFRSYLLSNNLYVALLAFQPIIAVFGLWLERQRRGPVQV